MLLRASLVALIALAGATAHAAPVAVSCVQARQRDLAGDQAEVKRATAPGEQAHNASMLAFDGRPSDPAFIELQHRYHQERREALTPLALRGNASAILALARQYQSADSGFAEPAEWSRLMHCAAGLGEPIAGVELMMETWHDKGDGSFAAIQRNRARTLDLVEQAADRGNLDGVGMLAIYIAAGQHQYPVDPDLGRRLFILCAKHGGCWQRLIEASERHEAFALKDKVDLYTLLAGAARGEPIRYAARRDALWIELTPEQQAAAQARAFTWGRQTWAELKPEWAVLRAEIVARDLPSSVSCLRGHLCGRP